jgi:hypothetical protein
VQLEWFATLFETLEAFRVGSNAPLPSDNVPLHACGVDDVGSIFSIHALNPVLSVDHFIRAQVDHFSQAPKGNGAMHLTPVRTA